VIYSENNLDDEPGEKQTLGAKNTNKKPDWLNDRFSFQEEE
jgi:hypothetical protein